MQHFLRFLLIVGALLFPLVCVQAQPRVHAIDSLKTALNQSRPDTTRANLLLELARSYIMKPGEQASDLDTAQLLVRQGYAISRYFRYTKGEGNAYLIAAQAYREKGNVQQARRFAQTAINRFTKNGHTAELAAAYMELGNTYDNSEKGIKQKIKYYELALPLFHQAGLKEREATTLKELADFYQLMDNYPKAIALLHKSLSIYRQIKYANLHGVYDMLGDLYAVTGDSKKGLSYGLLALKTAERQKDTTMQLCTIYNRLAILYENENDFKPAIQYYNKSLDVARKYNDLPSIGIIGTNLSIAHCKFNKYTVAIKLLKNLLKDYPELNLQSKIMFNSVLLISYQRINQYNKALKHYNELISQISEHKKQNNEYKIPGVTYGTMIEFLIATNQFNQAKSYLKEYYSYGKQQGNKIVVSSCYLYQFRLDSAQGNYLSAINHYKNYKLLRDSMYNENKTKELARLSIEFETEKKEQQLQLLTQKNRTQQASISQQENQRNSLLGGAALLLALLGVTYNRYRLKQRSNQQLEAKQRLIDEKNQSLQQVIGEKENLLKDKDDLLSEKEGLLEEREWMLKEIHHRVKNNLQVISSMLNSQFDFLNDPTALAAIRESQNRVQVMALIHQKLYLSDNLGQINMKEYVHEIVDYLIESFDRFSTIHPQIQVAQVFFDVSLATPLGLIINEVITNSLKYAFPQNRPGTVIVSLAHLDDQTYWLTMSDDGVGLPADFDVARSNTLGLTMIRGLSKQIKGTLDITQCNGLEFSLQFSLAKKPVKTVLQQS